MNEPNAGQPVSRHRLPLVIALSIGFVLLPLGVVLLPLVPELGIPLLLVATRLLGRRFAWARRFNAWIDSKWRALRARLAGDPATDRPALWRWIVGAVVILLVWQVLGAVASIAGIVALGLSPEEILPAGGFGIDPIAPERAAAVLFVILISFVPFLVGNLLAYRYILKRRIARLVTNTGSFSIRRTLIGFTVWFALGLAGTAAFELLNPGAVNWAFDPEGAAPYIAVALLLIPLQTTAEELFFRGWLLQWADNGRRRRSAVAIVNGFIFALPHLANPEVGGEDVIRIVGYIAVGTGWAWVTLRDGTLELAIGAHAANNLSAALIAGYVGSAIPSISLFMMDRVPVAQELVLGVAGVVAFAWITGRRRPLREVASAG